jgi:hypothetical protein
MPLVISQGYGSPGGGGGGGGSSPVLISVTPSVGHVTLVFDGTVTLTGDSLVGANWSLVANDDSSTVPVVSATVVGGSILLATGETGSTRTYTLHIPDGIFGVQSQGAFLPTTTTFTGVGAPPTIASANAISSNVLEVIFSEPVRASDALTSANYSITNGLTISGIVQINASTFRLTTSQMVSGLQYTITAANIRDAAGNPM